MATTFKTLTAKDVASTRNLLHEAIPLTGAIVSGTYSENNIKNYAHGMFQSVFDYPFLSSSANHIFDLTCGFSSNSALSASTSNQNAKKCNIYTQMSQILVGYDENSLVRKFDEDGNFVSTATKINEAYMLNFTRLLTKDEVKKQSFTLELGVSASYTNPFGKTITLRDTNANSTFKVNSPAGEYGILYASNSVGQALNGHTGPTEQPAGLIYYQAGIAIVTASVFSGLLSSSEGGAGIMSMSAGGGVNGAGSGVDEVLSGSTIQTNCNDFRNRIYNISFNNTTELNSTVYFCRAHHTEFNYSSSPSYISGSRMVVKNNPDDIPVAYVTTVGLYSPDNELLAVAKLSEPLKKDPTTEFTIRVRLDY